MNKDSKNLCPCCSGKTYDACCKPFHQGALPENALQLMRSRYSAYVLNFRDYIIATTHPENPQYMQNTFIWKRSISLFSKKSTFHKLEIIDFKEEKTSATVTFTAYISQDDCEATFTEKSHFEKVGNKWLYHSGKITQGRNAHPAK